jgi:hypothetical protein
MKGILACTMVLSLGCGCAAGATTPEASLFAGRTEAGDEFFLVHYRERQGRRRPDVDALLLQWKDRGVDRTTVLVDRDAERFADFQARSEGHRLWMIALEATMAFAAADFSEEKFYPLGADLPDWALASHGQRVALEAFRLEVEKSVP